MLETDQPDGVRHKPAWLVELGRSISAKLMASIFVVMLAMFALLGYFSIRLHQKHLLHARVIDSAREDGLDRHHLLKATSAVQARSPHLRHTAPGNRQQKLVAPESRTGRQVVR